MVPCCPRYYLRCAAGAPNLGGTGICCQIDLYDLATATWYPDAAAAATGSHTPTMHNMVASVNGRTYVLGGAANNARVVSTLYEYDIAATYIVAGSARAAQTEMAILARAGAAHAAHSTNAHLFLGEKLSPCLDRFLDDPTSLPEFISSTRFGVDLISF